MKNQGTFLVVVFIVIMAAIIYLNLPFNRIPDGIPADYFDRIELIEDSDATVYVYSDTIDFNGDYNPIQVNSIDDIPLNRFFLKNFLVIDMNKYTAEEFGTAEEIDYLYRNQCFYILIVDNGSSESTELNQIIDSLNTDSDLITLNFTACHDSYFNNTLSGDLPSHQMMMYAILDEIGRIIEGV